VFWFCGSVGGDPFGPDPTDLSAFGDLRPNFDELEAGRIAVYPIDARGLTVNAPGGLWSQHVLMNDVAEATGGHAIYNQNFLSQATNHLIESSNDFYTLSHTPHDFNRLSGPRSSHLRSSSDPGKEGNHSLHDPILPAPEQICYAERRLERAGYDGGRLDGV
jgi:hypothetical protein